MKETKLTRSWSRYDGDYEKSMQDIKLKNGDVVLFCWPNAGFWNVCKKEGQEQYYNKNIPHIEAEFVRLTHERD